MSGFNRTVTIKGRKYVHAINLDLQLKCFSASLPCVKAQQANASFIILMLFLPSPTKGPNQEKSVN